MGKTLLDEQLYLRFRTRDPEMALAWVQYFSGEGPWSVGVENILNASRADAIVSPANSYGYMDGGIDLQYRNFFGLKIQRKVQEAIKEKSGGRLPVGEALIVPTCHHKIPRLIVAPTMETPRNISKTNNVYLAMKAVLEKTLLYNERNKNYSQRRIREILVPSLGTGVGRMEYFTAAEQMKKAIDQVRNDLHQHGNSLDYLLN